MRTACAWLLALLMPFHAWIAFHLDWRGPAHVHTVQSTHSHGERDHYAIRNVHRHAGIERHHHRPADASVVAAGHEPLLLVNGRSGTMVVAAPSAAIDLPPPTPASTNRSSAGALADHLWVQRLDRPPRPVRA